VEAERIYKQLIWQDSDRVSGAVCFYGTRVPVQHMFDYINGGQTIEEFCVDYRINVEQARSVIALAMNGLDVYLQEAA
jgi:uncharacterized protein (DUF433 family)